MVDQAFAVDLDSWPVEDLLCQLLILDIRYFGYLSSGSFKPQSSLQPQVQQFLQKYMLGGVILFRENLSTPAKIINLTTKLQKYAKVPRFIAVDQEGGVINRIKNAVATPGNMALGVVNDLKVTTKVATLIASELSTLGINLNLAPVADINSNLLNPIIGVRAFGDNSSLVTKHSLAYINGLKKGQVIACIKHFPGHGDVVNDPHLGMAKLNLSLAELKKRELIPFIAAIKDKVPMIMTAHIALAKINEQKIFATKTGEFILPVATMSPVLLTTILREQLRYTGVVITDAMDMQAITNYFDPVNATVLSIKAGSDIVLMPIRIWDEDGINQFKDYLQQLCEHYQNDPELRKRVKESVLRVLKLKRENNLAFCQNQSLTQKIQSATKVFGKKANYQFAKKVAREAINFAKNATLPWSILPSDKILVIANNSLLAKTTQKLLKKILQEARGLSGQIRSTVLDYQNIDVDLPLFAKLKKYSKIIVLTYNLTAKDKSLNILFKELNGRRIPYVMLSCRNPYDGLIASQATTNLLIYGVSGFDQTNYKISPFTLNLECALELMFNI